jgi:hypothetical protein
MTLKKVENGRYRSSDGLYEVEEAAGGFVVNVRNGYRWETHSTHRSRAKAEDAVDKLQNKEVAVDPLAPVETEGD